MASIVDSFGSCRVVAQLASGPLSDVYHAIQEPLGRDVAVKALRSTMMPSSAFAAPLSREADLLARLHHPNILELYDFVRTDIAMWLVLEYVDGVTLASLVAKSERLDVRAAMALGIELARALAHAHDRGVVHRDVKPANVILSKRGEVKLVDFGIAHDERLPSSPEPLDGGTTFGTPAYMSPEQILGEPVDGRTDLFSLGVVLYQLVAGVRPFDAPDSKTVAQRIRQERPPALRSRTIDVPRSLDRIVMRCLEKAPGDRYASALELGAALEEVLRELTPSSTAELISEALVAAKVIDGVPPGLGAERAQSMPWLDRSRRSLWPALRGYLVLLALVVAGGILIQHEAHKDEEPTSATRRGPLELVPPRPGALRVLAHPWAEVAIDGQSIDTTPLSKPIPLSAGTHYITLRHPKAREERRVVRIVAGETLLLEATLNVHGASSGQGDAGDRNAPDMADDIDAGEALGL